MKAKVIKKFRDKTNGNIRHVGEVFTCNKERFAEITKAGAYVVDAAEEATAEEATAEEATAEESK